MQTLMCLPRYFYHESYMSFFLLSACHFRIVWVARTYGLALRYCLSLRRVAQLQQYCFLLIRRVSS